MEIVLEQFIRNSDNQIKLTLTEDEEAISGAWSELDIWIQDVHIHRTADGDGVELNTSTGVLILTPSDLLPAELDAVAELSTMRPHRVRIVVTSVLNDEGVVFGGGTGAAMNIYFHVSDKPA